MVSSLMVLGLAALATAAPFMTERDLNSTKWTPDHVLQQDEVILYGQGRSKSSAPPIDSFVRIIEWFKYQKKSQPKNGSLRITGVTN